jgi:dolichyl-phosphate-mannose--protein O-mannosyl transferase
VNPYSLWENFGALYLQAINLLLSIFGSDPFSLRLIAAIGGSFAVLATYLLARQISGHRVALVAAALLAVSHTHVHFSRTVAVAYIQGTWMIPLEFYFLLSGITKRSSWRTALGGMLLAFHYSIYLDAQIITGLMVVYLVIAFIFLRSWLQPALRQVAVFWGGFAIMILPELAFILANPKIFFERLSKDGMFQSGWLPEEMARTGASVFQILLQRVVHTFLSLIYYPSFDFYGSAVPVLSLISALLFLLGLGIVFWKTRSPGFLMLNGHFWSGVLAIALFSLPASADSYRLLIVLPVVFIIAAIGLDYVLDMLGLGWSRARPAYVAITSIVLLSLVIFNTWTYYADFLGQCKYGSDDGPTRFASYLGNYARVAEPDRDMYLLSDEIYMNGTHQSVAFLSHKRNIINLPDPMDGVPFQPGSIVVASPNRIPELQAWAQTHPNGKIHTEYDCGNLMLYTYQFP